MADRVHFTKDKTIDEEIKIHCIKCSGKTIHRVVASYDLFGEDVGDPHAFQWATDNQIIQCLGCEAISFRSASSSSEDWISMDCSGGREYYVDERIYPLRTEGVKGLGEEVRYLPETVRRIYDETLQALSGQSNVLAGIGLRALLEAVCNEKHASGRDLLKKIDSLVDASVLTQDNAEILHRIRTLGNSAAHEMKPHNEVQLELAMRIVEHLLNNIYILPRRAASEFEYGVR